MAPLMPGYPPQPQMHSGAGGPQHPQGMPAHMSGANGSFPGQVGHRMGNPPMPGQHMNSMPVPLTQVRMVATVLHALIHVVL